MALTHTGLAEVEASSEFTQRVYVRLTVDARISELLDARYAGVIVDPVDVKQHAKWVVAATQAGVRPGGPNTSPDRHVNQRRGSSTAACALVGSASR